MVSYKSIGRRLQSARKQSGLTQDDVENTLGLNRVTISNIENGKSKVDSITLKRFADLYGYSVGYFLEPENNDNKMSVFFRADSANPEEREIVKRVENILFNYNQMKEVYLEEIGNE